MAGASLWAIFMRQNATRLRSSDCRGNKKRQRERERERGGGGRKEGENVRTCARVRARKHAAGVNRRDIFPQRENPDGDVKTKRAKRVRDDGRRLTARCSFLRVIRRAGKWTLYLLSFMRSEG